jgi:hypothetical protein
VPSYVWISLGVFVVCFVTGAIWAGVNARRAWRDARPALARMNESSAELSVQSMRVQRRLETLEPKTAQLQRDVARLSRSAARARVLFGSVKEVRTAYRVVRFFT